MRPRARTTSTLTRRVPRGVAAVHSRGRPRAPHPQLRGSPHPLRRLWGEDSNLFSGDIKRYDSSVDMWAIGVVAYALLCGEYPFVGLSMRDLKKAIHECAPHFGRGRWKEISDEAKHFCKGLLQRDPKLRMSATQAREHPFIQKVSEKRASETASHMLGRKTEIVNSFQTFSKADPLQKLAFELIAFTTPPTKLDELRELFQKVRGRATAARARDPAKTPAAALYSSSCGSLAPYWRPTLECALRRARGPRVRAPCLWMRADRPGRLRHTLPRGICGGNVDAPERRPG